MTMPIQTGNDTHSYEIVEGWGMSDATGIDGTFDVAGVGVDSRGHVYLFNRGQHPVVVLNQKGEFLRSWGDKKMFPNAHAVTIGPDDSVWLTDTFDHTVRKCTPEGKILLTLGTSGKPAKSMSGLPFCRCTHVALHPATGELFVSDGYGNASVHKYTPDGRLLYSWGEPGNRPGQFNLPHNIATDRDGYVYVADRENSRVQIFSANGKLEDIWTGMARPCGMYIDTRASQMCYIGELSSAWWCQNAKELWDICNQPGCGPRISLYSLDGKLQATLLDNAQGDAPNQMIAPHGIAVDSAGDIYVGEVSITAGLWFPRKDTSKQLRTVVKLAKINRPISAN
jgi:DNA-binding beta-propeller fold protein YncE